MLDAHREAGGGDAAGMLARPGWDSVNCLCFLLVCEEL